MSVISLLCVYVCCAALKRSKLTVIESCSIQSVAPWPYIPAPFINETMYFLKITFIFTDAQHYFITQLPIASLAYWKSQPQILCIAVYKLERVNFV